MNDEKEYESAFLLGRKMCCRVPGLALARRASYRQKLENLTLERGHMLCTSSIRCTNVLGVRLYTDVQIDAGGPHATH
jgi:hypothetical protein